MKGKVYILFLLLAGAILVPGLGKACSRTNTALDGVCSRHVVTGTQLAVHGAQSACCEHMPVEGHNGNHLHHQTTAPGHCSASTPGGACTHDMPGSSAGENGCGQGCHCTLMGMMPLFLPVSGQRYLPHFMNRSLVCVVLPFRLPSGFVFIWRPPKIG